MTDSPATRQSLLVRLRNPRDGQAWAEFVAIYTPLIDRLAQANGLQSADAADLAQEVFRAVARATRPLRPGPRHRLVSGLVVPDCPQPDDQPSGRSPHSTPGYG